MLTKLGVMRLTEEAILNAASHGGGGGAPTSPTTSSQYCIVYTQSTSQCNIVRQCDLKQTAFVNS